MLVEVPKRIGVIVKVNSTNMNDDSSDITGSQMTEAEVRALKRRLEEVEKENRLLRSEKKQKRAPKKNRNGVEVKHLRAIEEKDRLTEASTYVVGKAIRTQLFRNQKYFVDAYKSSSLQHACRLLNFGKKDEEKFSDYLLYYIDKKITQQRNNAIHALKRLVLGLDGGKSRQMNVASILTNTNTN